MNKFKVINTFLFVLFFSTSAFSQSELWNLIMSKGTGYTDQRWKTRTEFPDSEIKQDWDDGYSISDLSS
ncbi:MAG: hypothetical protein HC831_00675 [Chloroflexia bacterium]|nr:hypothetical protein [Chloroflexia bacterium]